MFGSNLIFTLILSFSTLVSARTDFHKKDIPIPWGMEIPFPWTFVGGDWISYQKSQMLNLYRFKVVRQQGTSHRQLFIQKVNPKTCDVVAEGVGEERNFVVYAQLSSTTATEWITVRSFTQKEFPVTPLYGKNVGGNVLLLSEWDLDSTVHKSADYVLGNISNNAANMTFRGWAGCEIY